MRSPRFVIYDLKRQFGRNISLYRTDNDIRDLKTGMTVADVTRRDVSRAIVLPARKIRDFVYDLSFIAANRNFTYGGLFDQNSRSIILSARDIGTFKLDLSCWVVYDDVRWDVKELFTYERGEAFQLIVTKVDGSTKSFAAASASDVAAVGESVVKS